MKCISHPCTHLLADTHTRTHTWAADLLFLSHVNISCCIIIIMLFLVFLLTVWPPTMHQQTSWTVSKQDFPWHHQPPVQYLPELFLNVHPGRRMKTNSWWYAGGSLICEHVTKWVIHSHHKPNFPSTRRLTGWIRSEETGTVTEGGQGFRWVMLNPRK